MAAHYDDPNFSYEKYWQGREYENESEIIALNKILKDKKFKSSADIGGGFGRLTAYLSKISKKSILIEPSKKMRKIGEKYLKEFKNTEIRAGSMEKTSLDNNSQDLIISIRVLHHIPQPQTAFQEVFRILKPGGIGVIEFANSLNFKARIQSILSGQPILLTPIEKRSLSNIRKNTIPFVNHHPTTIFKQINKAGLQIESHLSVSNFRSPSLKQLLPLPWMLKLESYAQSFLTPFYFGPSIFVIVRKP